ncbi:PGC-1 and ERR-induced regulator in muscle protein 1 isoform X1 [Thunnus albacares]|uniref:PGC-1 and ERR-induced regulator in muscle protein 1 isoform X1 n=1 Tax=Thunnus albacares TaxID=8236 RepID=UPI001CF62378|nr:PGC-1 and ERR-induced regulator in muscle protein 1 isoform X1 [Thunnus albacares]XP_044208082.1 PGC-1 and ERR-induced regulator in muscle protein 1 isoform X1 [Thunnus albacares]
MEDFEYSVEISDRDWDCFFQECEECSMLSPALAGLDDSGMSDMDETASILANRVKRVDLTAGLSEADRPVDGPPDCEGSPVEHFLSKHGVGGMESVLSGSEEDIHLQSVNIFFERLKSLTEAEKLPEPNQVKAGENREAIQEEELCSDGKQASSSISPKNIPKLNSPPARGETAGGKETTEPVDAMSNINTMKKVQPGSKISHELAASNSVLKTNISAPPQIELFIQEEDCTETRANKETLQNQSHDSPNGIVCSETSPQADKVVKVKTCTPFKDVKQKDLSSSQCNTDSQCNLEIVTNVKRKDEQNPNFLHPDATCTNKATSQETSPSASIKRKRRKKRRLSSDPAENGNGHDRQVLVKQSDSDEEQYTWRGGRALCLSDDINLFNLNEPQKNATSTLTSYSVTNNFPVIVSGDEIKASLSLSVPPCDSQYQHLPDSIVQQGRCKAPGSTENNATNEKSVTPKDDGVISALNNSANVATNSQPCSKLQVEEMTGLNINSGRPVSLTEGVTGESDPAAETANSENKYVHAGSLQQSDEKSHNSIMGNEQNQKCCSAEVNSITPSILSTADSNHPAVEVIQNEKLSTAKSVLAAEAGNSGRDNHTHSLSEAEPQQQLEIDRHDADHYSSTLENTHLPLSATGGINCDVLKLPNHNEKSQMEIPTQTTCDKITSDGINSSPDKSCRSKSPSRIAMNTSVKETEHPLETLSKLDALPESANSAEVMVVQNGNSLSSGEINLTGNSKRETNPRLSTSEDLLTTASDITSVSSCCTLDTESVTSLSNGNITDMSVSSFSSVSPNDSEGQGEKASQILATNEGGDATSEPKDQSHDTTESKCDLVVRAEDAVIASNAECEAKNAPDSKHSVFAMSSFWNEMEKLTINDILGLRMMNKNAPAGSLTPLEESEENDMLTMTDSGFLTEQEKSKPEQTGASAESNSGSVAALDSTSSRGIMWESAPVPVSQGADINPETMMLTSVSDVSQPVLSGSAQKYLRKISKNISVHNLPALESESFHCAWKGQTLQTLDEGESAKAVEYFTDGHVSKEDKATDCLPSSSKDSYRTSFTDIFRYIFGNKQPIPSQSDTDNITAPYIDGNSVPEMYDHFFSEFDTESFFSPLITAEEKDELVPIFSYSRSTNKNLQFPEAYDYFFTSSSTDDSSLESDEEDDESGSPVKVVTRFTRKASSNQISTDIYDNFFTDSDLKQNFFWKTTFSFRNVNFTGSTVQKQTSSPLSLVPVRQSAKSLRGTIRPLNALGHQDMTFPDPLLYHLEDRISRQLAQQPFRYEDLQIAVSNPRLDASFLPLRQSDMCLVCIAFASWVLKTANPQVGDAWKAVLLANVSALSAIRYLRKYVKVEAAASERELQETASSDS